MTKSLNESISSSQVILDGLAETIIMLSENGVIKLANQTACDFLEYKKEELIGLSVDTIIGNQEFINSADFPPSQGIKNYLITKEGNKMSAHISGKIIHKENREILYYSNNFRKKNQIQDEICFEKVYFDEIFNHVHFAMVLINNNAEVLFVNSEFYRLFGFKKKEAVGKQIYELMALKAKKNEIIDNIKLALQGKKLIKEVVREDKNREKQNLLFLAAQ